MPALRLMSWNVRSLRDDRGAVVAVIRACAPDVLFLQEVPRFLRARSRLAALARDTGLVVASGGRPAAAVALLTALRVDVAEPASHRLSKTPGLHQRGLATARLSFGERSFNSGAVHLGLDAAERGRHAAEIEQILGPALSVVAGDLNETSDGPAWQQLATGRADPNGVPNLPTFSTANPRRRIDTILVPASWIASAISPVEIVRESALVRATDHRPVIVDVLG